MQGFSCGCELVRWIIQKNAIKWKVYYLQEASVTMLQLQFRDLEPCGTSKECLSRDQGWMVESGVKCVLIPNTSLLLTSHGSSVLTQGKHMRPSLTELLL